MNSKLTSNNKFEDKKINVKVKLATLWTSFMFLYIYIDYFHLFMPNQLQNLLNGKVFKFNVSQNFLLAALISVAVPALMIYLSVALPTKINRKIQLSLATLYVPYTLFNLVGLLWIHMIVGALIETTLLGLIIVIAWNWPKNQAI